VPGDIATLSPILAGLKKFWIIHRPKYDAPNVFIAAAFTSGDTPCVLTAVYVARSSEET
jgi:hypothetical protein